MAIMVMGWTATTAQHEGEKPRFPDKEKVERYEAMKVAHITSELDLSAEEAQKFWPVYNEWNAKRKELRKDYRPETKVEDMTEKEAEAYLDKIVENRRKMAAIEDGMLADLKGVLSADKVVKLLHAEKNFHKTMVRKIRDKHGREGRDRPRGERFSPEKK